MSARFAEGAARLSGMTCRLLGWAPDLFWAATPAEIASILTPDGDTAPTPLNRTELNQLLERECHG